MSGKRSGEPLYNLIRKIRRPATYRELIAACLRSIYTSDPFVSDEVSLTELPQNLLTDVKATELLSDGLRCVIYSPQNSNKPLPLLVYMHGGGFVVGSSEDTDYITRKLCESNQLIVFSVNYRLAPEVAFPGALEDCERALSIAISRYQEFNIDPNRIYLAGDSAGGNLAISLYHRLEDGIKRIVKGLILFAPWLDMEVEKYESYNRLAPSGIVFDSPFIGYARAAYCNFEQWKNPLVSPILSVLKELPPSLILIGTDDPLLDQALALEKKAYECSASQIEVLTYAGMPHCFYSFPGLFEEEQDAFDQINSFVSRTLKYPI